MRRGFLSRFLAFAAVLAAGAVAVADEPVERTDGEIWNEGVDFYRAGDVTNALRVLRPLLLSRTHAARAAEVVAQLEYDRGNLDEAAAAAQIALRGAPADARVNRNFTRATDRLPEYRKAKKVERILKAAEGKDPGALFAAAAEEAKRLMTEAGSYRTNAPAVAVAKADRLSKRAETLAEAWLPVRELIAQSVTNEEQAATIVQQIEAAQAKTEQAATEIGDLADGGYATLSDVEHEFNRFRKLIELPPAAMAEDLVAQSNAWQDAEAFNGRPWQPEALDHTRAFRAKFPAWAKAYEQQAQSDTNRPPFTAEDQAKVSALATELEKVQLTCCEKVLPPEQEKALDLIRQIQELLPKDKNGSGGGNGQPPPDQQKQDQQKQDQDQQQQQDPQQQQNEDQQQDQASDQQQGEQEEEPEAEEEKKEDEKKDEELEALLKKAQERNDEHEADKKARQRKAPLPPNERDW